MKTNTTLATWLQLTSTMISHIDSMQHGHDVIKKGGVIYWFQSICVTNIQQILTDGKNQQKLLTLSRASKTSEIWKTLRLRGAYEGSTTKCNVVSRMGSWDTKRTLANIRGSWIKCGLWLVIMCHDWFIGSLWLRCHHSSVRY
jgi:hypothetical protein